MFIGDFGVSYTYRVPVSELVMARIGVSIPLALYAILLSTLIAIPIGIISASNHGILKTGLLWDLLNSVLLFLIFGLQWS